MSNNQEYIEKPKANYTSAMLSIGILFFIFGFITWINGVLIPFLRIACELTETEAYFVTFAFYIAYTVMAIPSGKMLKRTGMVSGMRIGLYCMAVGSVVFIPAAINRSFILFLAGLFITGTGLTILQIAVNPYVTILGPAESAAKRISIMGLCNKFAGILAPLILGSILLGKSNTIVANIATVSASHKIQMLDDLGRSIIIPYVIITVALLLLGYLLKYVSLPQIDEEETNRSSAIIAKKYTGQITAGFVAVFCAVGVEVMAGDTISNYGLYHGFSLSMAKNLTSYTLSGMLIGYLLGIILIPKYLKQELSFLISAVSGALITVLIIILPKEISVFLLAALGVVNALLWPAIWPTALRGLSVLQIKRASAILIMGIAGGAIIPLAYGYLLHFSNNQLSYIILLPCYLYLIAYSVNNHFIKPNN